MTANKIELKPCPFCGGNAVIRYAELYFWVECDICHTRTGMECGDDIGLYIARSKVIERWNTRYSPVLNGGDEQ